MREVALAREIHEAGVAGMKYMYMGLYPFVLSGAKIAYKPPFPHPGFYIHSCPKMRYKGEYMPSYLADPEEYTWVPLEKCCPHLDKNHYACFEHPERSLTSPASSPRSFVPDFQCPSLTPFRAQRPSPRFQMRSSHG